MLNIVGLVDNQAAADRILKLLEEADMQKINSSVCLSYDAWVAELPTTPCAGLADACRDWIKYWGSGGGDYSTECAITEAIKGMPKNAKDIPAEIAKSIYESVCDFSKTPFEASVLTMDMVIESLAEVRPAEPENLEVACAIIDLYENLLASNGVMIPDANREGEPNEAAIFGDAYYRFEDEVRNILDKAVEFQTEEPPEAYAAEIDRFFRHSILAPYGVSENVPEDAMIVHNAADLISRFCTER